MNTEETIFDRLKKKFLNNKVVSAVVLFSIVGFFILQVYNVSLDTLIKRDQLSKQSVDSNSAVSPKITSANDTLHAQENTKFSIDSSKVRSVTNQNKAITPVASEVSKNLVKANTIDVKGDFHNGDTYK